MKSHKKDDSLQKKAQANANVVEGENEDKRAGMLPPSKITSSGADGEESPKPPEPYQFVQAKTKSDTTPKNEISPYQFGSHNQQIQKKEEEGTPTSPANNQVNYLVSDGMQELLPGQMTKSNFLAQLKKEVTAVSDQVLAGTIWSVVGCPWLQHWFNHYENKSAAHIERAIQRFGIGPGRVSSAQEYIPIITAKVGASIKEWATNQEEEQEEAAEQATATNEPQENTANGIQRKENNSSSVEDGESSVADVQSQIGSGQAIAGSSLKKFETAFGTSFSDVRIHQDSNSAKLAEQQNAKAFTIGKDIVFNSAEYQPGTLVGDALIAHELAHVEQQKGGATQALQQKGNEAAYNDLEVDADERAVGVVAQIWGKSKEFASKLGGKTTAGMKSGLQLQRCEKKKKTPTPTPVRHADQHEGLELPNAADQPNLQNELAPGSVTVTPAPTPSGPSPAPTAPPTVTHHSWDGIIPATGITPAIRAKRLQLKNDLTAAMQAHLNSEMPRINATASIRRLPVTELAGAGNAAKEKVDTAFGDFTSTAAFTPSQSSHLAGFTFNGSGTGQTLFDAYDPAERTRAGFPLDPADLAGWISNTDNAAQAVQQRHHFNQNSRGDEKNFYLTEVLTPFVAANRVNLEKYDLFGFAISGNGVVVPTSINDSLSDTSTGGEPSPAERSAKWQTFKTLVHEYMHKLEHPAFLKARDAGHVDSRVMFEGFCEMFTKEILAPLIPNIPSDKALCKKVEGGDYSPPTAAMIGPYSSGEYARYVTHAEKIRDNIIGGAEGKRAVKAAFFQGHVEYIGLNPDGTFITTPVAIGKENEFTIPSGISTLTALASASGLTEAEIRAANPSLTGSSLPSKLNLPGCREHLVVEAGDGTTSVVETLDQIAKQNGVLEAELRAANPSVTWSSLTAGQRLLIPKH